jgi:hypothetical protein
MKRLIIFLIFVSYIVSVCIGAPYLCALESTTLIPTKTILTLESSNLPNSYLAAEGVNCPTILNVKCGKLYGLSLSKPVTTTSLNQHPEIQWELIKNHFYCLKSVLYNAFLYLEGSDCNSTKKQCGQGYLYKSTSCTESYGWKITMLQNSYALQSFKYPKVYLFLNIKECKDDFVGRCGNVMGLFVDSTDNVKDVLFNVNQVTTRMLPHRNLERISNIRTRNTIVIGSRSGIVIGSRSSIVIGSRSGIVIGSRSASIIENRPTKILSTP